MKKILITILVLSLMFLNVAYADEGISSNENNSQPNEENITEEIDVQNDETVQLDETTEEPTEEIIEETQSEETTEKGAGITPDSFLYDLDLLLEDLQLTLTFDDQKKAELLIEFAKERLLEASEMQQEEKIEYVKKAVKNYIETLEQAQEKVSEVVIDTEEIDENIETLQENLVEVIEVDEEIEKD